MRLQPRLKTKIKKFILKSGALRAGSRLTRKGVAILNYHSVLEDPDRYADYISRDIIVHSAIFEKQLRVLARKFNPVSIEDILRHLERGTSLPPRPVAVTFDDGYADNFHIAAPLLKRHGVPASFYVTVNCIETGKLPWVSRLRYAFRTTGKKTWVDSSGLLHRFEDPAQRETVYLSACSYSAPLSGEAQEQAVQRIENELETEAGALQERFMLNWDEVRELSRSGHIVGSHTLTHPNLAYVGDNELRTEMAESKRILEKELSLPIHHFAYPNPILAPNWTDRTVAMSKQVGYRTAGTSTSGLVYPGDSPLSLRRVAATEDIDEFVWNLECTFLGRAM